MASHYSVGEEIANSVTHGLGVIFGVVALTLMLTSTIPLGDGEHIASAVIYGASIILVFLMSTLYHAIPFTSAKRWFKLFDHCAIYLLIAGTFTPYLVVIQPGEYAMGYLVAIWTLALLGVTFKLFFIGRFTYLSVAFYLGMGWMSMLFIQDLARVLAPAGLWMLAIGGICYTVGVLFYVKKATPFTHAIWHIFVLGGAVCHFVSIYVWVFPDVF